MNLYFHHIGIATMDINKSILQFKDMGYNNSEIIFDHIQNVQLCFLTKDSSPVLELVASISKNSPINNIISKVGTSTYHLCYSTNNLEMTIANFKLKNYRLIIGPVEASAFDNRKICFMYNSFTGLIEFLENN